MMKFEINQGSKDVLEVLGEADVNVTMTAYEALALCAVFIDNSKDRVHSNLASVLEEYKVNDDSKQAIMKVLSAKASMMRSNMSLLEARIYNEVMGARFKDANA